MARSALSASLLSVFGSFALLMFQACEKVDSDSALANDSLSIIVSVPPQADFVQRIGGDHVKVDVLVGLGQDPHNFSPTPSQMAVLSGADLFLTVGMPFEEALSSQIESANTGLKVVSMSEGFEKIPSYCDHSSHGSEEDEDDGHDHAHEEDDPHVWLSPPLVKVQATNIAAALKAALPEHGEAFDSNLSAFQTELDALHNEIKVQLNDRAGEQFFVFHPAFGYFGDTYDIEQVAVEVNGNEPTPNELAKFIEEAKNHGMKTLFVQPQFDNRSAKIIADQLGARVESLDPLDPDVISNIRRIAKAIAGAS
jgi:zinc transport system substrate-binding protein